MSKTKIHFEEANFLTAQNYYEGNQQLLADAIENYNAILGTTPGDVIEFQKDIYNNTVEGIKAKYKDAFSLGLSVEKLCDLFSIDLGKIKELCNKYTPNLKEPKEEDFYLYAETPIQLKRFDNCQKLIDAWELFKDTDREIILPPNPFVQYKNNNKHNPLIANYNYVLKGA